MKTCTKCKLDKPESGFSKDASRKDGLQPYCKECNASYVKKNAERIAEQQRNYRKLNSSSVYAQQREWRKRNPEAVISYGRSYYESNKEAVSARNAIWSIKNPDSRANTCRKRRAKNLGADGSHTASDVKRIFYLQRGLCANCNAKLFRSGKNKYHIDHVMPLSKGGSNWPSNLQCLCPTCNLRKNAKDPFAWAKENGRLL